MTAVHFEQRQVIDAVHFGEAARMEKFRTAFVRFRSGNAFLITLAVFLAGWFIATDLLRVFVDPDHGLLNLILSVEASVAGCLLLDQTIRQGAADREIIRADLETDRKTESRIEDIQDALRRLEETQSNVLQVIAGRTHDHEDPIV